METVSMIKFELCENSHDKIKIALKHWLDLSCMQTVTMTILKLSGNCWKVDIDNIKVV